MGKAHASSCALEYSTVIRLFSSTATFERSCPVALFDDRFSTGSYKFLDTRGRGINEPKQAVLINLQGLV